ncbi:MAG: rod shape-determining protein MreD [Opitutales bacterium]
MNLALRIATILLLTNPLVVFLNGLLGHWFAPLGLAPYLGGLTLVYACMHLPLGAAMAIAALTGLAWDAIHLQPFGLSYVTFVLAIALTALLGRRVRPEAPLHVWILALVQNAFAFLATALALTRLEPALSGGAYWLSVAANLLLSTALVGALALWFVALQRALISFIPKPGGLGRETSMEDALTRADRRPTPPPETPR